MGREDNVIVFQDTKKLCKNNPRLIESQKKSRDRQKLILEETDLSEIYPDMFGNESTGNLKKYDSKANVVVSHKRTYEAASAYKGKKVAVLNFASASNPGGGVVTGASAQEECLCRCSTLYFNLDVKEMWDGFYTPHRNAHDSLHNDDIIYTPEVTVFKTDTYYPKLMPEQDWYDVDVITCAAPNLREKPANMFNPFEGDRVTIDDESLQKLHEKRLRRILDVAAAEGCEVVILGAFGCGAFRNDPEVVAKAAKTVLSDYLYAFEIIEFAVYTRRDDTRNFDAFKDGVG